MNTVGLPVDVRRRVKRAARKLVRNPVPRRTAKRELSTMAEHCPRFIRPAWAPEVQ